MKNNNGYQGMKTNNEEFDEDNHHKTTTGMEKETDNHNHMTNMAAVVAHDEGDDEHGTRTEGTGDGL